MRSRPLDHGHRLSGHPVIRIARRSRAVRLSLFLTLGSISNTFAQPILLTPSDAYDDQAFGYSVDISGNALAATSSPAGGAAYVFRFNGTTWSQEQIIQPGTGTDNAALEGNVLAIPDALGAGNIYRYDGVVWQFEQAVQAPVGEPALNGRAALSGNHLLLGALGPRAYVYQYTAGTWTHAQTLSIPAASNTTLALRGDYLAVGGDQTVSVFHYDGALWQPDATLTPPGPHIQSAIDYPLALDPPYLMVGHQQMGGASAVRVYSNQGGSWSVLQDLQSPALSSGASFGYGIALEGDMAVIGAPTDFGGHGEAWVMRLCNGLWQPEQRIPPPTGIDNEFFAFSVAMDGSKVAIGAPYHQTTAGIRAGEVYVDDAGGDCNGNGLPDGCELSASSADCDHDFVLDQCQPFLDCNSNTRRDACDIADLTSADCNQTGTPDECDIASGSSADANHDGIPDECFAISCPPGATSPIYSLKAVSINGQRVPPSNSIVASPGDQIDADVYVLCWGTQLEFLQTYQASVLMQDGAASGDFGSILPLGWDAPVFKDNCPCTDPEFPICDGLYGCIGPQHDPELGASLDFLRLDFLLYGFSSVTATSVASLNYFAWGGTIDGDGIVVDDGVARYAGTLHLVAGDAACGDFQITFRSDYSFLENSAEQDPNNPPLSVVPQFEPLTINVCADDGLFCNGLETCDAQVGCQIIPPPSCNDGVACTVDSCDEAADGCAHALNHSACDDGNVCTRDECTPTGCANIDDQCGDIPTTSHWGLAVLALCLLIGAKLRASQWRVVRGE